MSGKTRGYALRVDVGAGAERVWAALTDVARLARWCGPGAKFAARQGGLVRLSVDPATTFEACVDVFDAPRRLRMIHMPGSVLPTSPTAMVDDLIVEPRGAITVVRLLGSGFPAGPEYDGATRAHETGWRRALARLKVYLEKKMDNPETTP